MTWSPSISGPLPHILGSLTRSTTIQENTHLFLFAEKNKMRPDLPRVKSMSSQPHSMWHTKQEALLQGGPKKYENSQYLASNAT